MRYLCRFWSVCRPYNSDWRSCEKYSLYAEVNAKLVSLNARISFAGYNVAYRRRKTGKVGFSHRLTKEDAMKWFQQKVSS